jgi:hypothetical protein
MQTYKINAEVFEVYTHDGGGISAIHIAYFTTESDAKKVCKDTSHWRIRKTTIAHTYHICESIEDLDALTDIQKRDRILSKLTPDEIKFLGLQ